MRQKIVIGNWKMNKTYDEAVSFFQDFKLFVKEIENVEIVIAPPFTLLNLLRNEASETNIKIAAQDVFHEEQGAFTGAVSPKMVKDFAEYVIIGHSERRRYFGENNQIINKKVKTALQTGLKVIFCLGESLEERNQGNAKTVIETQLREGLANVTVVELGHVVIAYEPVWAIGTGNTATPEQAEEIHVFLRQLIKDLYNEETAENFRIIYGGSVNPNNAADILKMPNIDGCLPGGASLDAGQLTHIIKSFS